MNSISDLDMARYGHPSGHSDLLAQFIPQCRADVEASTSDFALAATQAIVETEPATLGPVLSRHPAFLSRCLRRRPSLLTWFAAFHPDGLQRSGMGAQALARYALAQRGSAWAHLVWAGKHAQAPVAVAQRPHYWCELDGAASAAGLAARDPGFLASPEVEGAVAGGTLLSVDPGFFASVWEQQGVWAGQKEGCAPFPWKRMMSCLTSQVMSKTLVPSCSQSLVV